MTEEYIEKHYYELYQFLAVFVIQCYEDKSDNELIDYYSQNSALYYKAQILPQAYEVLKMDRFPAEAIEEIAMIWFEDKDKTKSWFQSIVNKLEAQIKEAESSK